MKFGCSRAFAFGTLSAVAACVWLGGAAPGFAQTGPGGGLLSGMLKQRLESVKQAAEANRTALNQYTWTESVQVSVHGEVKATKQMNCRHGADGKPQCAPSDAAPEPPQAHGLVGRIKAEKKEEFTDYIKQVKALIANYVPLDSAKMQAAHEAGNVSLSRRAAGEAGLVFKNYSLPGDSMTLDFSMQTHKLSTLAVNSYLGDPSSAVTLAVQFALLPDGTSYPAQETINAAAKGIQLVVSNSNYQKTSP